MSDIFDDSEFQGDDLVGTAEVNADTVGGALAQVIQQIVDAVHTATNHYENGEEIAVVGAGGYRVVIYKDNETNGELN